MWAPPPRYPQNHGGLHMCALTFIPEMKAAGWQTPWRTESWSRAALCAVCRGKSDLKCKTKERRFCRNKGTFSTEFSFIYIAPTFDVSKHSRKKTHSIDVVEHYSKLNCSKYSSRFDHFCVHLNHILLKNSTIIHFQLFGRSKQIYCSRITLYFEFLPLFMARFTASGFKRCRIVKHLSLSWHKRDKMQYDCTWKLYKTDIWEVQRQ